MPTRFTKVLLKVSPAKRLLGSIPRPGENSDVASTLLLEAERNKNGSEELEEVTCDGIAEGISVGVTEGVVVGKVEELSVGILLGLVVGIEVG